ncbi:MAG: sulfurtransferase [Pseudomonadales bacterium]|nr:sulfurtransferase [Pseudomonadales bacterium]NRA18021.1 sulfurtransferase [Oceanospirillaceae bacterium]
MQANCSLVSVSWLASHYTDPDIIVLDASMVSTHESTAAYIPGSQAFDYAKVFCDRSATLPCTMPSDNTFTEQARLLGINQHSTVIVYDQRGLFFAPRAWWMFKAMGLQKVYVLAGGMPKWQAQNLPTTTQLETASTAGDFTAVFDSGCFVNSADVLTVIQSPIETASSTVIDVRSADRFYGRELETRPGLRSGHIPHSINFPFSEIVTDGELISSQALKQQFAKWMPYRDQQYIFSCGSGVTACITLMAAWELGYTTLAVYDGSWTDWGADANLPIEV